MHNPTDCPLSAAILWRSRYVKKSSPRTNENQTCVFLIIANLSSVLTNKVVRGEFGSVERALEMYVDDFQVWFLGFLVTPCNLVNYLCEMG